MRARHGQRPRRARPGGGWRRRTSLLTTTIAFGGALMGTASAGTGQTPTASTVNVKDEGRLRLGKSSGAPLLEERGASRAKPRHGANRVRVRRQPDDERADHDLRPRWRHPGARDGAPVQPDERQPE